MKKILIQYYKNKPVDVVEVKELTSLEINELKKECEINYKVLQEEQEKKEKLVDDKIKTLEEKLKEQEEIILTLVNDVKVLKGEDENEESI